ncbi:hypothetical protein [Sphingomonas sp.]|uniref:hypothetical protein n=1 Tax=Sphingomonas sp. TaxID=28214 RepID=UPI002DD69BB1|nr:hypothetical protein [Sphingomonas sp.]
MTGPRLSHDYYTRRAEQERRAADRSEDPVARRVHLELADRYDMLTISDGSPAE